MYGYRAREVDVPPLVNGCFIKGEQVIEMDPSLVVVRYHDNENLDRTPVTCSMGPTVYNACWPRVDRKDNSTAVLGSLFRYCRLVPKSKTRNPALRKFVMEWLESNLRPLPPDADTSVATWLASTPYALSRKKQLLTSWEVLSCNLGNFDEKYFQVKSFVKDEYYPTYKHARAINSRSDEFKCAVGPICALVSKGLFALPWFIKTVPIDQRPQYIIDRAFSLGDDYKCTDYTSFEAHFTPERMEDCEHLLFEYMTKHLPDGRDFLRLFKLAKSKSPNVIHLMRDNDIKIEGKRMSGEMDTSTSNGFSNLMFFLFLCRNQGIEDVRGVVEGDDGLFSIGRNSIPQGVFDDFGVDIKLVEVDKLEHASFCGMIFDMEDKTIVTDPIDVLVSVGWCPSAYVRAGPATHATLLRARALSLGYQYPRMPLVTAFVKRVLFLTRSHCIKGFMKRKAFAAFNQYEKTVLDSAYQKMSDKSLIEEPGIRTRLLIEELYSISVADQLSIERDIEAMELKPLFSAALIKHLPPACIDYYNRYHEVRIDLSKPPALLFPKIVDKTGIEDLS